MLKCKAKMGTVLIMGIIVLDAHVLGSLCT